MDTAIDQLFALLAITGVLLAVLMLCTLIADGIDALQRRPAHRPMASPGPRKPQWGAD